MIRVNKTILLVLVLLFSILSLWAGSGSEAKGIHAAALKGDLESVKKGVYYTVKKLSAKAVFPMHAVGSEERYVEFAKEARKAGIEGSFCCAGHSGDWFFIDRGSVKKAYTLHKVGHKHEGVKEGEKKGDKKVCKKKHKEKKQP
jgi:hypothetical protein